MTAIYELNDIRKIVDATDYGFGDVYSVKATPSIDMAKRAIAYNQKEKESARHLKELRSKVLCEEERLKTFTEKREMAIEAFEKLLPEEVSYTQMLEIANEKLKTVHGYE